MHPPSSAQRDPPLIRIANVLVIVAVVAMLIGAVVLLLARDHGAVDIASGEEEVVLERSGASWQFWGKGLEVRLVALTNATTPVTLTYEETTGTGKGDSNTSQVRPGRSLVLTQHADVGEEWVVSVRNDGDDPVRAVITVTSLGNLWVGGALVAFGVLGFVFHRVGMRHGG